MSKYNVGDLVVFTEEPPFYEEEHANAEEYRLVGYLAVVQIVGYEPDISEVAKITYPGPHLFVKVDDDHYLYGDSFWIEESDCEFAFAVENPVEIILE